MIFALMLLPILGVAGLAVDYSMASLEQSRMKAQADSAALYGTQRATQLLNEGRVSELKELEEDVMKYLRRNHTVYGLHATVEVKRDDRSVSVVVDWRANPYSIFGNLFNVPSYPIYGISEASARLAPFTKLYIFVDVSQSMGIGATQRHQLQMFERDGCMFACHLPHVTAGSGPGTTYDTARRAGNLTRLDIARSAILEIVDMAAAADKLAKGRIKIGVYTFANTVDALVDINGGDAGNFERVYAAVRDRLLLGREGGGSDAAGLGDFLKRNVTSEGDGASAGKSKVSAIIITDGLSNSTYMPDAGTRLRLLVDEDNHNKSTSMVGAILEPRSEIVPENTLVTKVTVGGKAQVDLGQMGPFDSRICTPLKDDSVNVMVAETQYAVPEDAYALKGDGNVDIRFKWLIESGSLAKVRSELAKCATEGFYLSATDDRSLHSAITQLGAAALDPSLRITR